MINSRTNLRIDGLRVGTEDGGLNRLDPVPGAGLPGPGAARFVRYRNDPGNPNSLTMDRVRSLLEDSAGEKLIVLLDLVAGRVGGKAVHLEKKIPAHDEIRVTEAIGEDADGDGVPDEPADGEEAADGDAAADPDAPPDDGEEAGEDGDDSAESAGEDAAAEPEPGELDVPGILGGEAADLTQATPTLGVATSRGTEVLSTRWLVPWMSTPTPESSVVIVAAPEEASVEVFMLVNGELVGPWRATIPPGGRSIVPVERVGVGGPVVVMSDGPVSVEAQVVSPVGELMIVPGIPTVQQ